ncbi:MAG TPA: MCP four helix bundle domain-containing protein, partial [Ignavibacteriaceae bacterium]|nr:MCP four helix bundle domain-containing protein [Ignavibacteriaceae bacterium]
MKSIKSKINFGLIFLFILTLVLGIFGILSISQLAQKTKGTIADNYSSIDYTMNMLNSLDDMNTFQLLNLQKKNEDLMEGIYFEAKKMFEENLLLEG